MFGLTPKSIGILQAAMNVTAASTTPRVAAHVTTPARQSAAARRAVSRPGYASKLARPEATPAIMAGAVIFAG